MALINACRRELHLHSGISRSESNNVIQLFEYISPPSFVLERQLNSWIEKSKTFTRSHKMSSPVKAQEPTKAEEEKLSPAELKKRAKAEKAARRAAQKDQQQGDIEPATTTTNGVNGDTKTPKQESSAQQQQKAKVEKPRKGQQTQKQSKPDSQQTESHHKRTPSQQQAIPIRRRLSQSNQSSMPRPTQKKDNKQVEFFSHLYTVPRRQVIEGVSKDVHPAVLALGFQISSYEIIMWQQCALRGDAARLQGSYPSLHDPYWHFACSTL